MPQRGKYGSHKSDDIIDLAISYVRDHIGEPNVYENAARYFKCKKSSVIRWVKNNGVRKQAGRHRLADEELERDLLSYISLMGDCGWPVAGVNVQEIVCVSLLIYCLLDHT